MTGEFPYEQVIDFDNKDLNKKIGKLIYVEASDSDIQEGYRMNRLWFFDGKKMYLLFEEDL